MFGIDAQMTYDETGIMVTGKNPSSPWDHRLIEKVRNVASNKEQPNDIVYIKRPRTKRYIDNEDEFWHLNNFKQSASLRRR